MKKLHLVLPMVAFLLAAAGVFATELSNANLIIEQRVPTNTDAFPCDLKITQSCPGGSVACTYTVAGPHFGKQVYLFNSNVSPATCVAQTRQP